MTGKKPPGGILALVSVGIILLDQITKYYVMQGMRLHETIPVIQDVFNLTYIRNPGAAFGMLASTSSSFRLVFFGATSIFALILLSTIYFRLRADDWAGQVSVSAILGGAVGNMLDRLRFGEVIDFLDFYVGQYHWPAFNVADAAISVGVVFLIIHFAFEQKPEPDPVDNTVPKSQEAE